jgi:stage II sporulation protein D
MVRIHDHSETYDLDFLTLQKQLGKQHIMSSDFTIAIKDETVFFTGCGKGHGVGLCLYSASALAEKGGNAVEILAKFFPNTFLYNLNAVPETGKEGVIR